MNKKISSLILLATAGMMLSAAPKNASALTVSQVQNLVTYANNHQNPSAVSQAQAAINSLPTSKQKTSLQNQLAKISANMANQILKAQVAQFQKLADKALATDNIEGTDSHAWTLENTQAALTYANQSFWTLGAKQPYSTQVSKIATSLYAKFDMELDKGTYIVGKNVPAGVYYVYSAEDTSEKTIDDNDPDGNSLGAGFGGVHSISGSKSDILGSSSSTVVRAVLRNGESFDIADLFSVTDKKGIVLVPSGYLGNLKKTDLIAGSYIVGKDIAPGKYRVSAQSGFGTFDSDQGITGLLGAANQYVPKGEKPLPGSMIFTFHKGEMISTSIPHFSITPVK